jgi:hypothetical protein
MPHLPGYCHACRHRRAAPGRAHCEGCGAARRQREATQRETRRTARKCVTCGELAEKNRRYCAAHLAYYAERARERAAQKKGS